MNLCASFKLNNENGLKTGIEQIAKMNLCASFKLNMQKTQFRTLNWVFWCDF